MLRRLLPLLASPLPLHLIATPPTQAHALPDPPATQTINHIIKQQQTTTQIMLRSSKNLNLSSCSSLPFTPSLISSPAPPPTPLILPPQTPQNPHLTQPLHQNKSATSSGTDVRRQAINDGKPAQNLPAFDGRLVRLQSRPRIAPRGPDGHICVICSTQS